MEYEFRVEVSLQREFRIPASTLAEAREKLVEEVYQSITSAGFIDDACDSAEIKDPNSN